jgi:hypothetical protein
MSTKIRVFIIIMWILPGYNGHVSWLFPKSRTPAFDSLNFNQYAQPCGGLKANENG